MSRAVLCGSAALLELDDLLGFADSSPGPQKASPVNAAPSSVAAASGSLTNGLDLLADLLSGASIASAAPASSQQPAATSEPPAAATLSVKSAADPFAGLLDLGSPIASAAPAPAVLSPPAATTPPLSSVFDTSLSPVSPPPSAAAAVDVTDPLALVLNAPQPPAAPPPVDGVAAVRVLQEEGIRVELKCQRGPPGTCEILAEFAADAGSKTLTQFRFEAAVPKYLQLQLEPPTDDVLIPGAAPVQQRMRVTSSPSGATPEATSPPNASKPLLMKCRVTFLRDGALVQKCANVSSFPSFLLES